MPDIIQKEIDAMLDRAMARVDQVANAPLETTYKAKIESAAFRFNVDQFHIIAKALQFYELHLMSSDKGQHDPAFLKEVDKLVKFFWKGELL